MAFVSQPCTEVQGRDRSVFLTDCKEGDMHEGSDNSSFGTVDVLTDMSLDMASVHAQGGLAFAEFGVHTSDWLAEACCYPAPLPQVPSWEPQAVLSGLPFVLGGDLSQGGAVSAAQPQQEHSARSWDVQTVAGQEADLPVVPPEARSSTHMRLLMQRLQLSQAKCKMQYGQDGSDLADLCADIPVDDDGNQLSIGSIAHSSETCRPCSFAASPVGCHMGIFCRFCHFKHPGKRRTRVRPCKGVRTRYRNLVAKLSSEAAADPETFRIIEDKLPLSIQCNTTKKSQLFKVVAQSMGNTSSGSSSAGPESSLENFPENIESAACSAPLPKWLVSAEWEEHAALSFQDQAPLRFSL
mmetsp:Transcript_123431/g.310783  ORF Transcript_123431/g.310783 Transcript_123431/m.310783 type:complete len:353 (+) Transcript_123431:43-1101(+)